MAKQRRKIAQQDEVRSSRRPTTHVALRFSFRLSQLAEEVPMFGRRKSSTKREHRREIRSSRRRRSKPALAVLVCVVAALAAAPVALSAGAGAVSYTETVKNVTEVSTDVNPCTGDVGTLTLTYNGVFHVTELTAGKGAGTFWATGTLTGTFSFVPNDSSKPSYTGHFTIWFGDNDNLQNGTQTETVSIHGSGSDGSVLRFHDVVHLASSATGVVVGFEKPSCG
jgi:hypothetical protein